MMPPALCRGGGGGGFGGGFGGHSMGAGGTGHSGHEGSTGISDRGDHNHYPYGYGGVGYAYGGYGYGYDGNDVGTPDEQDNSFDEAQKKQIKRLQSLPTSAFVKNYSWPSTSTMAINGQPPPKRPSAATRQLAAKRPNAQQHPAIRPARAM